jgi:hypothetical protein
MKLGKLCARYVYQRRLSFYINSAQAHAVLPTGKYIGRKTQKWPNENLSRRKNPRPKFFADFSNYGRKVAELFRSMSFT